MNRKSVAILGTRGIPARHGGFETFAEHLAHYLAARGWDVHVYCQDDATAEEVAQLPPSIHRIHVPVAMTDRPHGTILFDLKSTLAAAARHRTVLTLGYNTAIFSVLYRLRGVRNIINMDGIEWKRPKWSLPVRVWLYFNEACGCWLANHLVADHPEIKRHLSRRTGAERITVIPYEAEPVEDADEGLLSRFGLESGKYALVLSRLIPDNSIYEIVSGFSRKRHGMKLVVVGNFELQAPEFEARVRAAANDDVIFAGAIYDKPVVQALRYFARLYVHGHTVGGTNPSLVEALASGSAVLANDNCFNRWVAGDGMRYFKTEGDCADAFESILGDDAAIAAMKQFARARHAEQFTPERVLGDYERLLEQWL